jgi:hypothetical protein
VVSPADVLAGTETTYVTTLVQGHTHEVVLTEDDLAMLTNGEPVELTTTIDEGHDHPVTITCT